MEEKDAKRTNPYLGPEFFTRPVAHLFFGRTQEARDLVSMAAIERVLLFYAPSGAGKTSLLNAKVIPQLEEDGYEVLPPGRVSGGAAPAPGVNVYSYNLMLSLAKEDEHPDRFANLSLREFLWHFSTKDGRNYFYDPSDEAVRLATPKERLWPRVLILDQFEEIVNYYPTRWEDREVFFRQLDTALHADPMLRVILSMRSDFVQELDRYVGLMEGGLRARYHMLPLTTANAREAIEEPAKLPDYNHPYEAGMSDRIVANMSQVREEGPDGATVTRRGEWVEPIQLQVVCYQLWERLWPKGSGTPGAPITMDGLKGLPSPDSVTGDATLQVQPVTEETMFTKLVDGALADFYTTALGKALAASAGRTDEAFLRNWFSTKLITESGARSFLQRRADETAGIPERVVRALVDTHLLRSDRRGNVDLVELVHDRFVQPIRDANLKWNKSRMEAQPWIAAGYKWFQSGASDASLLLRDEELAAVLAQKTAGQPFEEAIEKFIEASQEAQEERDRKAENARLKQEAEEAEERAEREKQAARKAQRDRRRFRALWVGSVVLFWVAAALAVVALEGLVRAEDARLEAAQAQAEVRSLLLANLAQDSVKKGNPDEALSLALLANEVDFNAATATDGPETRAEQLIRRAQTLYREAKEALPWFGKPPDSTAPDAASDEAAAPAARVPTKATMLLAKTIYGSPTERLMPHDAPVYGVALNEAQNVALSGGEDGSLVAWNPATGEELWRESAHSGKVWSVAISPDGKRGLSAGDDGKVIYWDLEKREPIPCIEGDFGQKVFDVAFDPEDGRRALFGGADRKLHLWDLEKCESLLALEGHSDWIYSVAFSPDGSKALSGSEDESAILWDLREGKLLERLGGSEEGASHGDWVRAVAFSPDGKTALTASRDILVWDLAGNQSVRRLTRLTEGAPAAIYDLAFDPQDSNRFLSASDKLELWDIEQGQIIQTLRGRTQPVRAAAFGDNGKSALSGSLDGDVRLWDLTAGAPVARFREGGAIALSSVLPAPPQECDPTSAITNYGPISEGSTVILGRQREVNGNTNWDERRGQYAGQETVVTRLAGTDGSGCPVVRVEIDDGEFQWRIRDLRIAPGSSASIIGAPNVSGILAVEPDGFRSLIDSDGRLLLTDRHSGRPLSVFEGHRGPVTHAAFAGDGRIVSAGADGTLRVWRPGSASEIAHWPAAGKAVTETLSVLDVTATDTGGSLSVAAVTGDGRLIRWRPDDPKAAQELRSLGLPKGVTVSSAATAADDAILLCAGDGSLYWSDGKQVWQVVESSSAGTSQRSDQPGEGKPTGQTGQGQANAAPQSESDKSKSGSGQSCRVLDLRPAATGGYRVLAATDRGVQTFTVKAGEDAAGAIIAPSDVKDRSARELFGDIATEDIAEITGWLGDDGNAAVIRSGDRMLRWDLNSNLAEDFAFTMQPAGPPAVFGAERNAVYLGSQDSGVTRLDWPQDGAGEPDARELIPFQRLPFSGLAAGNFGDEQVVVTSAYSGTLALWDATDGRLIKRLDAAKVPLYGLATSQDGRWAAAGAADGQVILWDLVNETEAGPLSGDPALKDYRHAGPAPAVAVAADGSEWRVLSGGLDGRSFLFLKNRRGKQATELRPPPGESARGAIRSAALTADGRRALLGREDGKIEVWQLGQLDAPPRWLGMLDGHEGHAITGLAFTADGATALSSAATDPNLILWDVEEREEIARLQLRPEAGRIALSPAGDDGRQMALSIGPDQALYLWQMLPPRDRLAGWVRAGKMRNISTLDCAKWEQYDLSPPTKDGKPDCVKEAPIESAEEERAPSEEPLQARVGEIRPVQTVQGKKQRWLFHVADPGQWLSVGVTTDRPAGDAPQEELEERGRVALTATLRDPKGEAVGFSAPLKLEAGDYELDVASAGDMSSGSYTLTLATAVTLEPGKPMIDATGNAPPLYAFEGKTGQPARITMQGDTVNSNLQVWGPDGLLDGSDSGGQGNSAQITLASPTPGQIYTIIPRAQTQNGTTGAYTLTLSVPPLQAIAAGKSVTGALETAPLYSFAGKAGQLARIVMRSKEFDSYLWVYGPDGARTTDDDSGGGTDAQIIYPSLPSSGQYTIVPRAWSGGTGAYTLTLSAEAQPITVGIPESGAVENEELYAFKGEAGRPVRITMRGDQVALRLRVYGPDGSLAGSSSGEPGNAAQITFGSLTPGGDYIILPGALNGTTGAYTLTLTIPPVQPIAAGASLTGTVESEPLYSFEGKAGQLVRIVMRSTTIDSYLTLYGPDGSQTTNDDNAGGADSQIVYASLPADGPYTVVPSTLSGGTGAFTLTLSTPPLRPEGAAASADWFKEDAPASVDQSQALNGLCWFGALGGHAADVLPACEQAAKLAPENGNYRDSLGLARALTGDLSRAIDDFNFAIEWARQVNYGNDYIESRTAFLEALKDGKDPFDAATLEQLKSQ